MIDMPAPLDAEQLDGTRYELSPRLPTVWLWQGVLLSAMPVVPLVILGLVTGARAFFYLAPVVAVAIFIASRAYHGAYLRRFLCVLLPDGVLLKRGVLFRSETFVPRPRIQHTDVTQGPIARHFGIATIKIFTAGSAIGQLQVEGLPHDRAVELRDRLLGRQGAATGGDVGHDAV